MEELQRAPSLIILRRQQKYPHGCNRYLPSWPKSSCSAPANINIGSLLNLKPSLTNEMCVHECIEYMHTRLVFMKTFTSSSSVLDGSPSGYKEAHPLDQISNASSFHTLKLVGSTTVGWMISFAGKTPQVTAFTSVRATLDIQLPPLFTAM